MYILNQVYDLNKYTCTSLYSLLIQLYLCKYYNKYS
nr:MAG TPA: hypothetical protein [Caudoviricetes sp.]